MIIMIEGLPYSDTIKVRFRDLDAQGHLYFANYLVYADEVLGTYMEKLGLDIMDPLNTQCLIFTVNLQCEYLNEILGGSEVAVSVGYNRLGKSSADAIFEIYDADSGDLMSKGSFTQVFVDPKTRKSMLIPGFYRDGVLKNQPYIA